MGAKQQTVEDWLDWYQVRDWRWLRKCLSHTTTWLTQLIRPLDDDLA